MKFASRPLRTQLVVLGLGAVLVPLAVLFIVVALTATSSEMAVEGQPAGNGPEPAELVTESASTEVPMEVLVAFLALSGAGGAAVWVWSARATRPMAQIASVANEIQRGSLDRRMNLEGAAAEVQALGDSFDRMLDRLSQSSTTQQELIEDASHELRTPLTALAVNNEVILTNPNPSNADYRASAERSEALIARLQLTIDELLRGARARTQSTQQVDNDLMAIITRVVDQHRALNPTIPVVVRGPPKLQLGIDGPSVQRALVNLVENAARYSPPGVPVTIDVTGESPTKLSVTDHGPGIAPDDLHRVFDRYYQSGSGTESGAGIGLALVKQVADAHGTIDIISPLPGDAGGTRFTITFSQTPR